MRNDVDANKRERNDTKTPCTQGERNPTTPLRDTHRRSPKEFGDAQVHPPAAGIAPNSPAPDVIVATASMTKSRKVHTIRKPKTPSGTWPPTFSRRAERPMQGSFGAALCGRALTATPPSPPLVSTGTDTSTLIADRVEFLTL